MPLRDEMFMKKAIEEAQIAFAKGEVPVGAILVKEEEVIARGHNQVEGLSIAIAHAEMVCLSLGSQALSNWRLLGTTLYTTLEPCSMCAGALLLARVSRLVWGAPDLRHGANGSWIDLFAQPHPTHLLEISRGVLEEECAHLLRQFFKEQRQKKGKDHPHSK